MGRLNFLHFLLFFKILVLIFFFQADAKTFWGDIQVLKDLKNALKPNSVIPGSCVSSWDFTKDPCDSLFSEHFTCGFRCDIVVSGTSRVTELALDQAGYAGSITSFSWKMPHLETLDLSGNFFNGQIPDSFSNLTSLKRLNLAGNSFTGNIPSSLGSMSKLQELILDNNNLQGKIPESFNNLVSLNRLGIQSNELRGEFPELGLLKKLNYLDVSNNGLTGHVPGTLPSSLIEFTVRNNSLEGTIPRSFSNMGNLQVLDMTQNKLTGSIPSFLFTHQSLQQVTLSFNKFTYIQAPSSFTKQSEIVSLYLNDNQLQGMLPSFLAKMPRLSALSVEHNKFTGMIPRQYALKAVQPGPGISPFARLLLGGNYLSGSIPGLFFNLKPGDVNVSLADNCLHRCPMRYFFCQGGGQKNISQCKRLGHGSSKS